MASLYGRGRDVPEIETAVEFVRETCRWRVMGSAAEVHRSDERNSILQVLERASEPLSPREVSDMIDGASYHAVRKTLLRMATAGEIKKEGRRPGESGNPNGRPPGSRNKTTLAVESLLDGEAENLTRKAIELAKDGDLTALRLCLERIAPPRKDRPVTFSLPKLEKPADAVKATAAIVEAVAAGDLTPAEASELGRVIEAFARAVEMHEFEERLTHLEQRTRQ